MKAIAYARVATREQADDPRFGIEAQLDAARDEIRSREWSLVTTAVDRRVRGSIPLDRRPGLGPALGYLDDGKADALVVSSLDRISNRLMIWAKLVEQSRLLQWSVVASKEKILIPFDDNEMMEVAVTSVNESELAVILSDHLPDGQVPGLRRGRPTTHTSEARQRIVDMRERGLSLAETARRLTLEGVPTATGGGWYASTVRSVLNSIRIDKETAATHLALKFAKLEHLHSTALLKLRAAYQSQQDAASQLAFAPDSRSSQPPSYFHEFKRQIDDLDDSDPSLALVIDRLLKVCENNANRLRSELKDIEGRKTEINNYIEVLKSLQHTYNNVQQDFTEANTFVTEVKHAAKTLEFVKYGEVKLTGDPIHVTLPRKIVSSLAPDLL